jgi:hypothetical protein
VSDDAMRDLIAQMEAATGPDGDIDRLISHHVVYPSSPPSYLALSLRDRWTVPAYTASIDAALTLVPDGLGRMSGKGRTRDDEPLYGCILYADEGKGEAVAQAETDAGEAICICIAALRARVAP